MEGSAGGDIVACRIGAEHDLDGHGIVGGDRDAVLACRCQGDRHVEMAHVEAFCGCREVCRGFELVIERVRAVVIDVARTRYGRIDHGIAVAEVLGSVVEIVGRVEGTYGSYACGKYSGVCLGVGTYGLAPGCDSAAEILFGFLAYARGIESKRIRQFVFALVADGEAFFDDGGFVCGLDCDFIGRESHGGCRSDNELYVDGLLGQIALHEVSLRCGILEGDGNIVCAGCHPEFTFHHRDREVDAVLSYGERHAFLILAPHLVAGGFACDPVDFRHVGHKHEYRHFNVEPFVVDGRAAYGDVGDGELCRAFVAYGEGSSVACAHLDERVAIVGAAESEHVLEGYVGRPYGFGLTGKGDVERYGDLTVAGHIGVHGQCAGIVAGHTAGVEVETDRLALARCERRLYYRREAYSLIELYGAFGELYEVFSVEIADTAETEDVVDDGVFVGTLILELEASVLFEDNLEAYADIHRVAVFHERYDGAVVGHIVICAGGTVFVHGVQTPVGCDDIGVYRASGEVGRWFGPYFVVTALGEGDEAGVVDIHRVVELAVEGE